LSIIIALIIGICFIYSILPEPKITTSDDEIVFKSSFTRGGSLIVPQKLIFTSTKVRLVTNAGSRDLYTTTSTHTIPFDKIVGVKVTRFLVGCNILIIGKGVQNIYAEGFTGEDANKIEEMINLILEN
jgi:hypothetical protein